MNTNQQVEALRTHVNALIDQFLQADETTTPEMIPWDAEVIIRVSINGATRNVPDENDVREIVSGSVMYDEISHILFSGTDGGGDDPVVTDVSFDITALRVG